MEDIKLIDTLIASEDEAIYGVDEIPKKMLIKLLYIAIGKIDSLENNNEFDMQTDYEYVFLDLLKVLKELLKAGVYDL